MSVLRANCPSCAGTVEFKSGSTIVVICPFCRSVVARTDRALEDLGKVAEIVQTESPLKIGLRGKYLNQGFELTGRAQYKHEAGGVWDEWYATFSNGWVGWLAEAQGRFYMTFYQPQPPGTQIPSYAALPVGAPVPLSLGSTAFVVAEKGMATAVAAEGEIPYQLVPNETNYYADLSGAGGAFGTIDYGTNPPFVFVGKQVSLQEIGLGNARPAERAAKTVSAARLSCPNCGGPLELKAPDTAERVTCPNCDSLLDVNKGSLRYLHSLKQISSATPPYLLEIGKTGHLPGRELMQIIGAMTRSVNIEGTKYFWQEYLLYNPKIGFRWLVQSDNHWTFVEPVAAGDVVDAAFIGRNATAVYNGEGPAKGKSFKLFQHAYGLVEHVRGEFYWRVETGEKTQMSDFVNAPFMLSKEISHGKRGGEINWSLGTYIPRKDVEKAFEVQNLPGTWNVAPNQPFEHKDLYKYGFALLGLLILVSIVLIPFTSGGGKVKEQNFTLPPMANPQAAQIAFSEPFELKANRNVEITVNAPVSNSWMDIDVDLVNEQSSEVESVPINVEFYSGTDSDGAWTEGSTSGSAILSSVRAGKYTLRIEGSWGNWEQPQQVNVTVTQNAFRGVNFCCAFVLLSILPILALIWHWTFETRRWSESMFAPVSSGSDDD
ncbi:MAG: DUF4178 domain-containing protein [Acidobacteriota bacterium]|nr:DUF4178 domain-containing protein [Acidobacteriota bacterium]